MKSFEIILLPILLNILNMVKNVKYLFWYVFCENVDTSKQICKNFNRDMKLPNIV